jgi:hypothetical protein
MYNPTTTPYLGENVDATTRMLVGLKAKGQLGAYVAQHKNDPNLVALATYVNNLDAAATALKNSAPQPTVVDQQIAKMSPQPVQQPVQQSAQLPENVGIGQVPAPNLQKLAAGGIVAFEEGGEVDRYQNKGVTESEEGPEQYRAYALQKAEELGLDPVWVDRIFSHESKTKRAPKGYDPEAVSPTGATGIGQLVKNTANHYLRKTGHLGLQDKFDPEMRKDPYKNIDASLAYMVDLKHKYKGDPRLMAVGYNQGETYLDNHLKQNEGKLNPAALKDEPKNYLQKTVEAFIPSANAAEVGGKAEPKKDTKATAAPSAATSAERPWYDRYRELMMSGEGQKAMLHGVQDVPAALLGAPVDVAAMAMRPFGYKNETPVLGSKWLKEKFTDAGVRVPDSTNPDLQNIRTASEGVATLYNPFDKVTKATKLTKEGIAALGAENKAAAVAKAQNEAELSGALSAEAKLAADAEAARRAALAAEGPTKAAAIQNANELAAARSAPIAKNLNPIGEASMLANADLSIDPAAAAEKKATAAATTGTPEDFGVKALQEKLNGGKEAGPTAEGDGLAGLLKDPMFLMGMRMMASKNKYFSGAIGEAGLGTAADMAAARKAESDAAKAKAEGRYYSAYADAMERGAKEKNMALEAEKLVQQHMDKWGSTPAGQLAAIKDSAAVQAEEARVRNAIYQQLGISPTMGVASAPPSTSGFKLVGVR